MSTDNNKVNLNKRLRDSPTAEPSTAKRTMTKQVAESISTAEDDTEILTTKSFRSILAEELTKQTETIHQKIAALPSKQDLEAVRSDVSTLSDGFVNHEKRLQQMERTQRSRNLIFKNIAQKKNYKPYIISLLQSIMGLEHIQPRSIRILKTFTERKQVILLVEFNDYDEVQQIFGKATTLKETNIILERDLSDEERKRKGTLLAIRREILNRAKVNKVAMKISVSESRIKFNNDVFIFNRNQKDYYKGGVESGVVLRDYLIEAFNLLVNEHYCIIQNEA